MIAETTTWRVVDGWSSSAPVPGDGAAVLLLMGDRETFTAAAAAGLDPLGDLRDTWAGRAVFGFSTAGQAVGDRMLDGALVATVLRFDHTTVRTATASATSSGSARRAGREVAHALAADDLRIVLFAADGISLNGSSVADGITDVLPGVDMIGVLAADGAHYEHSWTLSTDGSGVGCSEGSVTAIGFFGDALEITRAAGAAWQPLGPERLVTASHGNTIRELDGASPAELYRDYLGSLSDATGDLVANCSMLPLEIRDLDDHRAVRSVRRVHPDGSVSVSGDVPQGATARLLRAGADDLVHDATVTAKAAREEDAGFCLVVSTAGRRRVLGERAEDEVLAVVREMPVGTTVVAGWGYGTVLATADGTDVLDAAVCVTSWRERPLDRSATADIADNADNADNAGIADPHPNDPRAEEG